MSNVDATNTVGVTGVAYPVPFDSMTVELCDTALRNICIRSPSLDHAVFDRVELADALSALVRRSRQTRVRILIRDVHPLIQNGHRLLNLARRMPSTVVIQQLAEHPDMNNETVVIRDRNGLLYMPSGSEHRGFYEPDSQASTKQHLALFEELWCFSDSHPELRSLSL